MFVCVDSHKLAQGCPFLFRSDFYHCHLDPGEYSCLTVDLTFKREFSYYLLTIYVPCCMLVIVSWVTSIYSILQNLHSYHPSTSFCNDEPIGQRVFICYRTLHHYSHCSMWESCHLLTFFIFYPTQLLDGAQKHYCCFINKKGYFFSST